MGVISTALHMAKGSVKPKRVGNVPGRKLTAEGNRNISQYGQYGLVLALRGAVRLVLAPSGAVRSGPRSEFMKGL